MSTPAAGGKKTDKSDCLKAPVSPRSFSPRWRWLFFVVFLYAIPPFLDGYQLYVCNLAGIAIIGALGLNLLVGYTGLISLGHGAFLGIGAYASAGLVMDLEVPFFVALPAAGLITAMCGIIFGLPSLRLKGFYLAIATLAAQFIIEFLLVHVEFITNGVLGKMVDFPSFMGFSFDTDQRYFYLVVSIVLGALMLTRNIVRSRPGRALVAIRDQAVAAQVMGINLFKYKLAAFGFSSFLAGVAGSLWAHYVTIITPEHFTFGVSIEYLAMIIIGGMGQLLGSVLGAIFMVLLPEFLRVGCNLLSGEFPSIVNLFAALKEGVFGLIIITFLIFEPEGLAHRWQLIKSYWQGRPSSD
ncbi:MAG: branched-chain amino acid ABC transporter permease [Deltaproteobacteria bacterium]|nr:branched-chain amino acid ABC transporter permease [Deltaproteobacteria bacterium]